MSAAQTAHTRATHALAADTFDDETPAGLQFDSLSGVELWVAWKEVPDATTGKPRKLPFCPKTGKAAGSTKAATWATRAKAEARARTIKGGVGLILGTHAGLEVALGGIDLDTCRDTQTGKLEPWANDVLTAVASYAEVSPSGTGVKVFFAYDPGDLAALQAAMGGTLGKSWKRGKGEHPPAIELHLGGRYYTVTGERLPDLPAVMVPMPAATLLRVINVQGPAFASAGSAAPGKAKAATAKPVDESRSGKAFRLAYGIRRKGGSRDDFEAALDQDADLSEWGKNTRNVERAWNGKSDGLGSIEGLNLNQDGLARAFTGRYPDTRYDVDAGCWFRYNENHWVGGRRGLAFHFSRLLTRDLIERGQIADTVGSRSTFDDIETITRRDPAHEVDSSVWNPDKTIVGTPKGTVETMTCLIRRPRKEDMITKQTSVAPIPMESFDPGIDCPMWLAFLNQATGNDADLIRFLQQWCGYCLTGLTVEHALVFIYGPGGNGKSVFMNTVCDILGDYAITAGMDVFTASKTDRHPQELARLAGVRLVCASETTEGRAWDETRIKTMTGGDPITARFMRQNDFTFIPQFKVMIAGNNKPVLKNVDDAMRRRINIVPFMRKPENPDPYLESKLRDEQSGILSWMIAGCLDWRANRLTRPAVVRDATAEYFDSQDTFGQWLQERCETGRGFATTTAALTEDWRWFAQSIGEPSAISARSFADRLKAKGFDTIRDANGIRGRGFKRLRLKPATVPDDGEDL